jgi:hypothetical protein
MPESRFILFDTKFKTNGDGTNVLNITIKKEDDTPNTMAAELNLHLLDENVNNKKIIPGNLSMVMKNHLSDIDFHLFKNGDLIVNAEDSKNYSINDQGHLIYVYR